MTSNTASPSRGKMVNSFNPAAANNLDDHTRKLVERRTRLLGPAYRLFYSNPVEVARGQGTRLYDSAGHEYLDAYNNVVSVGHCHPRVVEAVSAQMQTLCTHTRYIQEGILNYAEALLATLGAPLQHVMFTCTGSEANDLLLGGPKHCSGQLGLSITE